MVTVYLYPDESRHHGRYRCQHDLQRLILDLLNILRRHPQNQPNRNIPDGPPRHAVKTEPADHAIQNDPEKTYDRPLIPPEAPDIDRHHNIPEAQILVLKRQYPQAHGQRYE